MYIMRQRVHRTLLRHLHAEISQGRANATKQFRAI